MIKGPLPNKNLQEHSYQWVYTAVLLLVTAIWLIYFVASNSWHLFETYWPMSLTMLFGSFVAGSTPQGGAVVAFPVFTKVLQIPSAESRTFGFMIQSVGMMMAAVMILVRRIRILPRVILWVTFGGAMGTVIGTYWLVLPNPYPRILFTIGATAFAVGLVISRWVLKWTPRTSLPDWNGRYQALFLGMGILGGLFSAQTGAGADMLTFILLTLAFGIDEKVSTPTTVIIMGLNSLVGFFLHGVMLQDIGIAWNYWLVAVPIVSLGAPIGAYVVSRIHRDVLISFILFLIVVEMVTTAVLIPFTGTMIFVTVVVLSGCAICFGAMLFYRQNRVTAVSPLTPSPPLHSPPAFHDSQS